MEEGASESFGRARSLEAGVEGCTMTRRYRDYKRGLKDDSGSHLI